MDVALLKRGLKQRWGIDVEDYWIPLSGKEQPDVFYFKWDEVLQHLSLASLEAAINAQIPGPYILIEPFCSEEVLSEFKLDTRAGVDVFYTNPKMDWVMYSTHEGTLTLAGAILIDTIAKIWPYWKRFANPTF